MSYEYLVQTEVFSGPLDLLLQLVEKRKLFISDISLAEVADDYIQHVNKLEDFPLRDAAQFVLIASTLLLIKSKSLLPVLELTEEEEEDIADLERRLVLYKKMKELAPHVRSHFVSPQRSYGREARSHHDVVFAPASDLTTSNLRTAINNLITKLPQAEKLSEVVVQKVISLDDMIGRLTTRIQKGIAMSFTEFSRSHNDADGDSKSAKVNIVVSFLAMLELVKTGSLLVQQDALFDDITISHNDSRI